MNKVKARLILGIAVVLMAGSQLEAQQPTRANTDFFSEKFSRFGDHSVDFSQLAESFQDNCLETDIALTFSSIADVTAAYSQSILVMNRVYERLSCEADRTATRAEIKKLVAFYIKQIDAEIGKVNRGLSYTKSSALATAGDRFKEDLRSTKRFLESIELR